MNSVSVGSWRVKNRSLIYRLRVGKAVEARKREIEVCGNVARSASPIEQLNRLADKLRRTCDSVSAAELSRHSTLPLSQIRIANDLRV
jgi:hypothetical protein